MAGVGIRVFLQNLKFVGFGTNGYANLTQLGSGTPNSTKFLRGDGSWASVAGGAGAAGSISAGTTKATLGQVVFANSNGVSFGVNGQTVTGSVQTNYLTTAALSNHSHGDPTLALTNLTGTTASASNGFTLSLSAAAPIVAAGTNGAITGGSITVNTSGVSVALPAYLTTARASNDAVGLNTAATQVTWTVNSSGISLNAGGYLTTARASNDAVGLNTAGTSVTWTVNSSGISLNAGAYLTTARASNDAVGLNTAGTSVTWTVNSSGISLNAGAYLTTAAQSNHSHGNPQLNLTNLAGTTNSNSAGFTLSLSHNISTAALSDHSHGNPTLNLTNLSGTTASNSAGFTLSLSGNGPGGGDAIRGIAAGGSTASTSTVNFSNSNGVSFGFGAGGNSTVMTASVQTSYAASNHSHGNPTLNLTNLSGTTNSNSAGFTLSLSAAAPGGGAGATLSGSQPYANRLLVVSAWGQGSLFLNQWNPAAAVQFDRFIMPITHSNATNSSGSATLSYWVGFYTRNASSLSIYASTSFTTGVTGSGTVGNYSQKVGPRHLAMPWTTTISAGNYWIAVNMRSTTGGANMSFGYIAVSQWASTWSGYFGVGSATTAGSALGVGIYSATTSGLPNGISLTQIMGNSSAFQRQPAVQFMSATL